MQRRGARSGAARAGNRPDRIEHAQQRICAEGLAAVIVEQDIDTAIRVASHAYCLMHGRVTLQGPAGALTRQQIAAAYFGLEAEVAA